MIRCGCTAPADWPPRRWIGPARWWPAPSGPARTRWCSPPPARIPSYAAVAGLARGRRRMGSRIITTAVDHSSVLARGRRVRGPPRGRRRPPGAGGPGPRGSTRSRVDGTALATIQVANHEVGTLQPYAEAIAAGERAGVPVVLDATAALGRVDLSHSTGWSVLTGWAGRLRRAGLGRSAGDQEGYPLAGAVPGRRLSGPPLARRARCAGHLRRRGGAGQLAAARPGGRRAAASAGGPAPVRDHRPGARRGRGRRPRAPGAAPADLLGPVRGRGDPDARSWIGRVSPWPAGRRAARRRSTRRTSWPRWAR